MEPVGTLAVILAGGRARRLGGVDKTRLDVAGRSALERVIAACPADSVVVVGPPGPLPPGVHQVQEDPPFGGPLAGLGCAITMLPQLLGASADAVRDVLVLGGDMPLLSRPLLTRLLMAGDDPGAVRIVVDADGHLQHLCSAWPLPLLRLLLDEAALPGGGWHGLGMRALAARIPDGRRSVLEVAGPEAADIDTPADLARLRARAEGSGPDDGAHPAG